MPNVNDVSGSNQADYYSARSGYYSVIMGFLKLLLRLFASNSFYWELESGYPFQSFVLKRMFAKAALPDSHRLSSF